MGITDELRRYISSPAKSGISHICEKAIVNIADRIDAEHESACAAAYGNGVMSVPIALDESAWVELPKDADGEIIHVGDMMERGKARGRVIALMLSEYPKKWGGGLHWGVQLEGEQAPTALDAFFKHYHEPTVEDMLWELLGDIRPDMEDEEAVPIVADYAKRLRLADGKEQ